MKVGLGVLPGLGMYVEVAQASPRLPSHHICGPEPQQEQCYPHPHATQAAEARTRQTRTFLDAARPQPLMKQRAHAALQLTNSSTVHQRAVCTAVHGGWTSSWIFWNNTEWCSKSLAASSRLFGDSALCVLLISLKHFSLGFCPAIPSSFSFEQSIWGGVCSALLGTVVTMCWMLLVFKWLIWENVCVCVCVCPLYSYHCFNLTRGNIPCLLDM